MSSVTVRGARFPRIHVGLGVMVLLEATACNKGKPLIEEATREYAAGDRATALTTLGRVATEAKGTPEVEQAQKLGAEWLIADAAKETAVEKQKALLEQAVTWDPKSGVAQTQLCSVLQVLGDYDHLEACLDATNGKDATPADLVATLRTALEDHNRRVSSICADLDTWEKPFLDQAAYLGSVFSMFRLRNLDLGASGAGAVAHFEMNDEFRKETSNRADASRSMEASVKSHGALTGEEGIQKDLVSGWEADAVLNDKLSQFFGHFPDTIDQVDLLMAFASRVSQLGNELIPQLHRRCSSTGGSSTGSPSAPSDGVSSGMLPVAAATFTMGKAGGGKAEGPPRSVTITKAFSIDPTEVTVADYSKCVKAGSCTATGMHGRNVTAAWVAQFSHFCNDLDDPSKATHPVNCVDRSQAASYCGWVGKRLPTDAEWELAARGTDGRTYPWGEDAPTCDRATMAGVGKGCGDRTGTYPVGTPSLGKSPVGALDMLGNVWEWVADGYSVPTAGDVTDPFMSPEHKNGVLRGGAWDFARSTVTARLSFDPGEGNVSTWFRCAK